MSRFFFDVLYNHNQHNVLDDVGDDLLSVEAACDTAMVIVSDIFYYSREHGSPPAITCEVRDEQKMRVAQAAISISAMVLTRWSNFAADKLVAVPAGKRKAG